MIHVIILSFLEAMKLRFFVHVPEQLSDATSSVTVRDASTQGNRHRRNEPWPQRQSQPSRYISILGNGREFYENDWLNGDFV